MSWPGDLSSLGLGRGGRGQGGEAAGGLSLKLCRGSPPLVRDHGAGGASWGAQRTRELAGGAQRGGRALAQLNTRVVGGRYGTRAGPTIRRTVEELHRFAKGKQDKRQVWIRVRTEGGALGRADTPAGPEARRAARSWAATRHAPADA
jgi:hypothetical protein